MVLNMASNGIKYGE